MEYEIVYVVMKDQEVVYASTNSDDAENYSFNKNLEAGQEVLDDWENDDPTDKDILGASFKGGFDGGYHDVVEINISNKTEGEVIQLENGEEIDVTEVLKKLKEEECSINNEL